MLRLASGNAMVAEGAIAAGCRFFAGYPITPASEIYQIMMRDLPPRGGVALSAPDEISSLCYCVGASLRGLKAMTATSGPGWALMIETIQYAVMAETPLVVALVQRLGPSSGGATQGAQGDLWITAHSVSGGYTLPIFAPSTAAECHDLTVRAFHWAERLRSPVVLLSDKEVGMTVEVVDTDALDRSGPVDRIPFEGPGPYVPYAVAGPGEVAPFAPVGGSHKVTVTGSAHDARGLLKKNAPEVIDLLRHLEEKIDARRDEMAIARSDLEEGADRLILAWGITARAARDAVRSLRGEGQRVSLFQPLTLVPPPAAALRRALEGVQCVVVAEENLHGQYRSMLAPFLEGRRVVGVNRIGGLIAPVKIARAVKEVAA